MVAILWEISESNNFNSIKFQCQPSLFKLTASVGGKLLYWQDKSFLSKIFFSLTIFTRVTLWVVARENVDPWGKKKILFWKL